METLSIIAILVALFFAFWNGFTDAANAISTVVATRALKPLQAVALSAAGNFAGIFLGVEVAKTIGKGIVDSNIVSAELVLAALIGGLIWDVFTYYIAVPVSESHVLIGGLVGAGIAAGGFSAVNLTGIKEKVVIPMVLSPTIGLVIAFLFAAVLMRGLRRYSAEKVNGAFKYLQICSSFFFSVTHGANDAQKTVGLITAVLLYAGVLTSFSVPLWVVLAAHASISIGTFLGGWRIVKTMGMRITDLKPFQGFAAETSAALILATTASHGFPVSTTHAIAGSIMGVGSTKRLSAVRWGVARKIIATWIVTIPMAAFFAFLVYKVFGIIL